MPDHDALDQPPTGGGPAPTVRGGRPTATPATSDLAAVPSFLRGRRGTTARSLRPASVLFDPEPEPAPITAAAVAALPMAGLPPRRLVLIAIAIVLTWMVGSFGRQVSEASAATARADELRATTAALAVEVAGLERELRTVQDTRYIEGAARAYRLGTAREIAFALEVGAPPLGPDAPGSGSHRLGADVAPASPLESWLATLFGPGR